MAFLVVPLLLIGGGDLRAAHPASRGEKITLKTDDRFLLTAEFHPARGLPRGSRAPAVILVHDAGGSRADLEGLADALASMKIGALRIDLRGHGESKTCEGGKEPFEWKEEEFRGNKPFLKMHRDLRAAGEWLRGRDGVDVGRIGVVGLGSGGALALRFGTSEDFVRVAVLVSPSLGDRGFDLTQDVKRIDGRSLLLVADASGKKAAEDLKTIASGAAETVPVDLLVTKAEGKSAELLVREKGLDRTVATWIRERLSPKKP